MTSKHIWHNGDWVPADKYARPAGKKSDFPCPQIMPDLPAYQSPLSFGMVEGRYQRREEMKRHDVREVDPAERPEGAGIVKTKAQAAAEKQQIADRPKYAISEQAKRKLLAGE